jgi:hypothetical protein
VTKWVRDCSQERFVKFARALSQVGVGLGHIRLQIR